MTNGNEMVPDFDYCAVTFMTKDTSVIEKCLSQDTDATCTSQPNKSCQWRKGKQVAKNTAYEAGTTLFTTNFCHVGSL